MRIAGWFGAPESTIELAPIRSEQYGQPCANCENFDIQSFTRDPFGFRGYSLVAAKEAARQGCPFCTLLIRSFEGKTSRYAWLPEEWPILAYNNWWIHLDMIGATTPQDVEAGGNTLAITHLRAMVAPKNHTLPYTHLRRGVSVRTAQADFHVVADPDDAAYRSGDVQGRYVGEEAQSDDYVATIKAWLKTCLSHSRCCQTISGLRQINTEQALLPTRCIDVLGKGLQLKETGSQTGSYIALSHRWTEESELCCTTTGNIDARRQGAVNDLQLLPKTFCHILDLARRLGVRYVWIDSLCIIQHGDDGHDWRQECVKMADYYQQSLLTVMATSGSREHGLFPPKANPPPTIARLPYRDRNGVRQGYFYVYSYDEAVGQQYHTFVQESELLSRGWVFQEWLLSRRIVCFTPSGMFMECETVRPRNERGETIQAWSWDDSPAGNQPLAKASFIFGTAPTTSQWYKIVESYSALSLTQPDKDRIVALAGIASEFRDALRGAASGGKFPPRTVPCGLEFASGLWVHDLHRGLLWAQKLPGCAPRRVNRSPTWSWASVSCPVIWDEHSTALDPKAEVVAVIVPGGNALSIASLPQTAPRSALPPARAFDVDNSFAYLRMTGKVQRVIVREMFSQEEELRVACDMLGHASESAKSLWRKACSNVQPMEITGWASIEHPDFQNESLFERGLEVSAFLISTTSKSPGYGLGFLTYYNIYNVIFIMNVGGQRYERLGVGRLFGKEIGDGFRMADAKHIELC